MKKYIFLSMFALAVLLVTSCSESEDIQKQNNSEVVTFTARIENGMNLRTRSLDATDETVSRAVLEIYNASSELVGGPISGSISGDVITFASATLEAGENYTCLFWADGGADAYDITNLNAVARATKPSIAYYAKADIIASSTDVDVTLTHAVAKVVLNETGTLAAGDKVGVSFNFPGYTFNVSDGSCTEGASGTIVEEFTISTTTAGQVGWLYVFAPATGADPVTMTLSYTAAGGEDAKTCDVSNIPLKRNYRTVLRGAFENIMNIGHVTQVFDVTLDENWREYATSGPGTLTVTGAGDIAADPSLIVPDAAGSLVVTGPVNSADITAIGTWAKANADGLKALDLSSTTGLTEIANETFRGVESLSSVILPASLVAIGNHAFYKNPMTNITLPEGMKTIGDNAFGNSGLTTITIPASVEYIGEFAIGTASLNTLILESALPMQTGTEPVSGNLVLNEIFIFQRAKNLNVFLPNITASNMQAYANYFLDTRSSVAQLGTMAIYYNYTGSGDRTNPANYTKWTE